MFCTKAAALSVLAAVKVAVPDAVIIDSLNDDPATFPRRNDGSVAISVFPVGVIPASVNPDEVSVYVIYGTQVERSVIFGRPNLTGIFTEFAGQLADNRITPGEFEVQLGGVRSDSDLSKLLIGVYVSPNDQEDPELFWRMPAAA